MQDKVIEAGRLESVAAELGRILGPDAVFGPDGVQEHYLTDRCNANAEREKHGTGRAVVVFPVNSGQVAQILDTAVRFSLPVVPRGAGTGLSGGTRVVQDSIVLSTERMNRILEINTDDQVAVVEPGVLNGDLQDALAPLGFFFAPDPASYRISTLGGNIATNAGGLHCAKYGVTRDAVLALEVVLPDGTLLKTGHRSIKGVSGLDLVSLFVGSEGILGVVVKATLRIRPKPTQTRTITAYFPSVRSAVEGVLAVGHTGVQPAVLEFLDSNTLGRIDEGNGTGLSARGEALLLLETDGLGAEAEAAALSAALGSAGGTTTVLDGVEAEELWEYRRGGQKVRDVFADESIWIVGEDIAVPKGRLPDMLERIADIARRHEVDFAAIAHVGDGNLHPALSLPVPKCASPGDFPERLFDAIDELMLSAIELGGTLTGEHGIGLAKRRWLADELDPANLALQRRIKDIFDPTGIMNPGKAI